MGVGAIAPHIEGLAQQLEGLLVTAGLVTEHPQQMQGIEVPWMGSEDLAVEALGIGQAPLLVVLQSPLERLSRDTGHGAAVPATLSVAGGLAVFAGL